MNRRRRHESKSSKKKAANSRPTRVKKHKSFKLSNKANNNFKIRYDDNYG